MFSELEEAVAFLAARTGASVVGIGQSRGVGSGLVVAKDRILTNAHNVNGGDTSVGFLDGRVEEASIAGVDIDRDLAVLAVSTGDAEPVEWSDQEPKIGGSVFALANPGGRGLRVTWGLLSGVERSFRGPRGRKISGSLEHTAPLLPGSSGGPLVDREGKLMGVNTHRLGEGFYLAMASSPDLREKVASLSRGETSPRPHLGIGIAPAHVAKGLRRAVGLPESEGLLVRFVKEGGPAEAAGIMQGDLLVSADGSQLRTIDDLYEVISKTSNFELTVLRGTEERKVRLAASV